VQALPKSQILWFVEQAFHLIRRAIAQYSSKFSKRRYTLHQHVVLLCLKVRKNTTYRTLLNELIEMPRVRDALGLTETPSPSTLCKAFNPFDMSVCRVLHNLSVPFLPTNSIVGIDASGFNRGHASKHYIRRAKLTIQQLKLMSLVDTRANAIIDLHVTTTRKHDTQIAPSLIRRIANDVAILLGDKGYDDQKI
jgi:IS5 family transposase